MPRPTFSALPGHAVAWALLSQSLWLPLLAIDLHDRWQAQVRQQAEIAAALSRSPLPGSAVSAARLPGAAGQAGAAEAALAGRLQAATDKGDGAQPAVPAQAGFLLGSASTAGPGAAANRSGSVLENAQGAVLPANAAGRATPAPTPQRRINGGAGNLALGWNGASQAGPLLGPNPILGGYNRAELLGGSLGLGDLRGAAMPPLALAERARWAKSKDPLAPLPTPWREPMRRAIGEMPQKQKAPLQISGARVVHVPSSRVRQSTVVPLALQPDGSVDILTQPDSPAVVEEIRQWSARQTPAAGAGVTAAVVHLEPLPEAPRPITHPVHSARSSASPSLNPAPVPVNRAPAPVAAAPVSEAPAAVMAAPVTPAAPSAPLASAPPQAEPAPAAGAAAAPLQP